MADQAKTGDNAHTARRRAPRLPLVLGAVLFLVGGGGGFYAVSSGLMFAAAASDPAGEGPSVPPAEPGVPAIPDIAYVGLAPLTVNLGGADGRVLRFSAQVEVNAAHAAEVAVLVPRIMDVLNSYLRAVDLADLLDRSALVRLRGQMLRRIQLVVGAGRVRDLLVMEFVLN